MAFNATSAKVEPYLLLILLPAAGLPNRLRIDPICPSDNTKKNTDRKVGVFYFCGLDLTRHHSPQRAMSFPSPYLFSPADDNPREAY